METNTKTENHKNLNRINYRGRNRQNLGKLGQKAKKKTLGHNKKFGKFGGGFWAKLGPNNKKRGVTRPIKGRRAQNLGEL